MKHCSQPIYVLEEAPVERTADGTFHHWPVPPQAARKNSGLAGAMSGAMRAESAARSIWLGLEIVKGMVCRRMRLLARGLVVPSRRVPGPPVYCLSCGERRSCWRFILITDS